MGLSRIRLAADGRDWAIGGQRFNQLHASGAPGFIRRWTGYTASRGTRRGIRTSALRERRKGGSSLPAKPASSTTAREAVRIWSRSVAAPSSPPATRPEISKLRTRRRRQTSAPLLVLHDDPERGSTTDRAEDALNERRESGRVRSRTLEHRLLGHLMHVYAPPKSVVVAVRIVVGRPSSSSVAVGYTHEAQELVDDDAAHTKATRTARPT